MSRMSYHLHLRSKPDGAPIVGARVFVNIDAPSGESRRFGPTQTDSDGKCVVVAPPQTTNARKKKAADAANPPDLIIPWLEAFLEGQSIASCPFAPGDRAEVEISIPLRKEPNQSLQTTRLPPDELGRSA